MRPPRAIVPCLGTRDLRATVAFYTEHLGFTTRLLHPPERPTLAILDAPGADGGSCATLMFDASLWPGDPAMTGQLVLDFGARGNGPSRVLGALERVRAHTSVDWGPEVYPYGRREVSIRDPNGYVLVLSEETDEPPTDAD